MQVEQIKNEFSARNVQELIYDISTYNRAKGSDDFHQAVKLLADYLPVSEVMTFSSNNSYNSWQVPEDFNLEGGYLRYKNGPYLINSLASQPTGALFLSDSTRGKETLELFDAGPGESPEDYQGYNSEAAIMADGHPTLVYYQAVKKRGARCLLLSHMRSENADIGRTREQMPGAVNYTSLPAIKSEEEEAFGFSLSWRQMKELRQKLQKQDSLSLEAKITKKPGTGELEIIKATAGENNAEKRPLLLTAHLCHPRPGANDNASGAALLAELMRVFHKFSLNRKIVAIWVPEMYGPAALLEQPEWQDFAGVINLDMVAQNQDLTGSTLNIFSTPWSVPSFISELAAHHLENKSFKIRQQHYAGGSDHFIFSNPSAGVPGISLTQLPDKFYHTDQDTPDKTSAATIDWVGEGVIDIISDLIEMSSESASATAARIVKNYLEHDKNKEPELVSEYRAFLAREKLYQLEALSELGPELKWLEEETDNFSLPDYRSDFRSVTGPIASDWMDAKTKIEYVKNRRQYKNWGNFIFELLNFMELGFAREEAMELARAEFDLPAEVKEKADSLLNGLQEKGLINI